MKQHPNVANEKVPAAGELIYGTAFRFDDTTTLVYKALSLGYRNFDLANWSKYYNEKGAGVGIRTWCEEDHEKREHRRRQIWVQTKFTPAKFHDADDEQPFDASKSIPDQIIESATSSIAHLNFDPLQQSSPSDNGRLIKYLDAILLHCPLEEAKLTLLACKVLEQLVPEVARHWGVSNIGLPLLRWVFEHEEIIIKPKVVQNRFLRSNNYDLEVRKYCSEKDITYQAFGVLKNRELLDNSVIRRISSETSFSPSSLVLGLLTLRGVSVLDATTDEQHMKDNIACQAWIFENVGTSSLRQVAEGLFG
ncbi:hypothetical protein TWF281_010358 [Arthrobotrys megalospora]